jgi:hypothetical protein
VDIPTVCVQYPSVMISLKVYCRSLAKIVGMSPDAVYERVRALMQSGYLSGGIEGRGPGSGIRATHENVTRLILSILATDDVVALTAKTKKIGSLKAAQGRCPLTGATRFDRALQAVLADEEIVLRGAEIEVHRRSLTATIRFNTADGKTDFSRFGGAPKDTTFAVEITARLPKFGAFVIAGDLADMAAGRPPHSTVKY